MKELCYFKYTNLYFKWFSKLDIGYSVIVRKALKRLKEEYKPKSVQQYQYAY